MENQPFDDFDTQPQIEETADFAVYEIEEEEKG